MNYKIKYFLISLFLFMIGKNIALSQEIDFKRSSIKTGIGLGLNMGEEELGLGSVYLLGWQKKYGSKEKLRLNPNLTFGSFRTYVIPTDTRDQLYKITKLGMDLHYDLIKYKEVSLVTTVGGFVNYSRGLLGTGGWHETNNNNSEYFNSLYFGAGVSLALRINPKNSKLAYEIRPLNLHFGNKYYFLGYLMFGIDFKLIK